MCTFYMEYHESMMRLVFSSRTLRTDKKGVGVFGTTSQIAIGLADFSIGDICLDPIVI